MDLKDELAKSFQERWTKVHKCDRPGCESCLIIDGDLKPHRMLCAAKLCGIREIANSDVKMVMANVSSKRSELRRAYEEASKM